MKFIVTNKLEQPIIYTLNSGETLRLFSRGVQEVKEGDIDKYLRALEADNKISIEEIKEVKAEEPKKVKKSVSADKEIDKEE